jgi:hypothetical protein
VSEESSERLGVYEYLLREVFLNPRLRQEKIELQTLYAQKKKQWVILKVTTFSSSNGNV